jgi:hypothetical protein
LSASLAAAENIDPANDGSQYAWSENVGWLNAEPNGDGQDGVQVDGSGLSGYMWGENIGWASLSCVNTGSCGTVDYGVENDNCGTLTGYGWAENVGWINFAPTTGGVRIDPQTGEFAGTAWGENIGWITFADDSPVAYGVCTSWRRYAPTGGPETDLAKDTGDLVISWGAVADCDGYDVFQGSLTDLLTSGGDFSTSTADCLAENQAGTSHRQSLSAGTVADFFLVRAMNCGGNGTCDSGGPGQGEGRDSEITSSGTCE